jgi:hypothetical protein
MSAKQSTNVEVDIVPRHHIGGLKCGVPGCGSQQVVRGLHRAVSSIPELQWRNHHHSGTAESLEI